MKTKLITSLLSLTFLFLFCGFVYGDDLNDGRVAYHRQDYKEAFRLWLPLAEQGNVEAQHHLGFLYADGQGVSQDKKEASK
jgi:uncharacterized protein